MILSQDRLKELLSYDPETGFFTWLVDRQRARKGSIAGTVWKTSGYRTIGIDYQIHKASRLAFLYMDGQWPDGLIDHIDRDRANDRWSNLRKVSYSQNATNRTAANLSGVTGVSWASDRNRWCAQIKVAGRSVNLGRFKNLDDAISARRVAEDKVFSV